MSNTFTAQELADFYQKVADGGQIETCFGKPVCTVWHSTTCSPHIDSFTSCWRIKPTQKVIDLSVLVDGIDCEFKNSNGSGVFINKLSRQGDPSMNYRYYDGDGDTWESCKPRMNHKHAWQGGECPLPEGFGVKVWWRSGEEGVMNVESVNWNHVDRRPRHICEGMSVSNSGGADIIAFEVLGLADGYVMPWEQDK